MWPSAHSPKPVMFLNLLNATASRNAAEPRSNSTVFSPFSQNSTCWPCDRMRAWFHSPTGCIRIRGLHAQGQHFVYARAFLAGRDRRAGRIEDQGALREAAGQRTAGGVRAGAVPRALQGLAEEC